MATLVAGFTPKFTIKNSNVYDKIILFMYKADAFQGQFTSFHILYISLMLTLSKLLDKR